LRIDLGGEHLAASLIELVDRTRLSELARKLG
jgi:hypothetical protein